MNSMFNKSSRPKVVVPNPKPVVPNTNQKFKRSVSPIACLKAIDLKTVFPYTYNEPSTFQKISLMNLV